MAVYATASDLVLFYDARHVGDLVKDDGTREAEGSLAANTKVTNALSAASGRVEAACLHGQRYTTADLSALTGSQQSLLKEIVCDVAMAILERRRRREDPETFKVQTEVAENWLEMLRQGKNVFDVPAVKEAGVLDGEVGPTTVELERIGLIRDKVTRFYPTRAGRLPGGR